MNFPTDAASKPNEPDLQFVQGSLTTENGQEIDVFPSLTEPGPSAEAKIECFNYGVWADLMVIAVMEDGLKIVGHLVGDPETIVSHSRNARVGLISRTLGKNVASLGGQHSGPGCILRYHVADAYVRPAAPQRRILYKDAKEGARVFCRSRIALPPGRYGNVTNASGNLDKGCLDQLRDNDAK